MNRWISLTAACALAACINDVPDAACGADDCQAETSLAVSDTGCDTAFDYVSTPELGPNAPVVELALDENDVYFMTHDALYKVARAGGALFELFTRTPRSGSTLSALWLRDRDVVVYQDAANVFAVPKGGGRAVRLPALERMRDGTFAARDAHGATGWNTVAGEDGRAYRELWTLDVELMQVSVLGRVPAPAGDDQGAFGAGHIFWTDDPSQVTPDTRLYSMAIEAGAVPTPVPVLPERPRSLRLFGLASEQLYVLGSEAGAAEQLLRLPMAGGELEVLGDLGEQTEHSRALRLAAAQTGVVLSQHSLEADRSVVRYWIPDGVAHAQRLPCLPAHEDPAFAVDGDELYSAVRNPPGRAAIVRRTLR